MAKDYYEILGVARSASADEIKKAFRKLAHQHHTDKHGGSDAKFKEINTAYQALSNPEKRQQYDQFGADFEQAGRGGGASGFNWQDFAGAQGGFSGGNINFDASDLGDIFGDFFGGGRSRTRRAGPRQGSDLQFVTAIDFKEAVFGTEKTLRFEKKLPCSRCHGKGAEPGSKISTCTTCKGNGQVEQVQRTFLGAMRTAVICPTCHGEGKTTDKTCTKCHGRGTEHGVKELKVKIPAGIDNEQTIRLSGEGEPGSKGGVSGDLLLTIQVRPDKLFTRQGYDLLTNKEISMPLATLGGKVQLATLDGEVYLKIPAGAPSGKVIKLTGKGVPHLRGGQRGDLLVTIRIHTPDKLYKKQRDALAILPLMTNEEIESAGWF